MKIWGGNSSPQQINLIINILNDFLNSNGKLGEIKEQQVEDIEIYALAPISTTKKSREERIDIENCLDTIQKLAERLGKDSYHLELINLDLRGLQIQSGKRLPISLKAINCDFSEADINLAAFREIKIVGCNICKTSFVGEAQTKMKFSRCCGYNSKFFGIIDDKTVFISSNMSRVSFQRVAFSTVRFLHCTLDGADFSDATFEDVKFESCTFLWTDFSGADLAGGSGFTQEDFNNIIYDESKLICSVQDLFGDEYSLVIELLLNVLERPLNRNPEIDFLLP
mgnify:CR=1 FL=1